MSDSRISNLPILVTPATGDILVINDISAPDPDNSTSQITYGNFLIALEGTFLPLSGGTMSGEIDMDSNSIKNLTEINDDNDESILRLVAGTTPNSFVEIESGTGISDTDGPIIRPGGTENNVTLHLTGKGLGHVSLDTNVDVNGFSLREVKQVLSSMNGTILEFFAALPGGVYWEISNALHPNPATLTIATQGPLPIEPNADGMISAKGTGEIIFGSVVNMGSNKIISLLNPTAAQDAATKDYVDTVAGAFLPLAGGTMSGDIDMDSNNLANTGVIIFDEIALASAPPDTEPYLLWTGDQTPKRYHFNAPGGGQWEFSFGSGDPILMSTDGINLMGRRLNEALEINIVDVDNAVLTFSGTAVLEPNLIANIDFSGSASTLFSQINAYAHQYGANARGRFEISVRSDDVITPMINIIGENSALAEDAVIQMLADVDINGHAKIFTTGAGESADLILARDTLNLPTSLIADFMWMGGETVPGTEKQYAAMQVEAVDAGSGFITGQFRFNIRSVDAMINVFDFAGGVFADEETIINFNYHTDFNNNFVSWNPFSNGTLPEPVNPDEGILYAKTVNVDDTHLFWKFKSIETDIITSILGAPFLPLAGGTMTGDIDMGGQSITSIAHLQSVNATDFEGVIDLEWGDEVHWHMSGNTSFTKMYKSAVIGEPFIIEIDDPAGSDFRVINVDGLDTEIFDIQRWNVILNKRWLSFTEDPPNIPGTVTAGDGILYVANDTTPELFYKRGSVVTQLTGLNGAFLPLAGGTMSGNIDMGSNTIFNLLDPVIAQEAATKNYVDTQTALFLPLAGGTMSGNIDMGDNDLVEIRNLEFDFTIAHASPAGTIPYIHYGMAGGININVLTGEEFRIEIGGFTSYIFDDLKLDLEGRALENVSYLMSGGANTAQTGRVRLPNSDGISWRNNADDGDLSMSFNTDDQFLVPHNFKIDNSYIEFGEISEPTPDPDANHGRVYIKAIGGATDVFYQNELGVEINLSNSTAGVFLPLAGGTMSGDIDMGVNDILNVGNIQLDLTTITYAANITLSFTATENQEISLTGNLTFDALSEPIATTVIGRKKTVRIICDGTTRTLSFPASWVFIGNPEPINIQANNEAILNLQVYGTTNSTILCSYAEEA